MVNSPTCDRAQGIALYLPQRPGAMRGGRNAHGGTVVLGVGLRTVPPQKQPPQIGHLAAEKRRQFRVRAALTRKRPMAGRGSGNEQRCSRGDFRRRWELAVQH